MARTSVTGAQRGSSQIAGSSILHRSAAIPPAVLVRGALISLALACSPCGRAQVNSWLKPTSGGWEEMEWSLGLLPGAGQTIMITNKGWRAVMISPTTVQAAPSALTIDSLTLSSPTNSYNVLLLNYAGVQNPLTLNSATVSSNTAVKLLGSALQLTGGSGVGMSVGGEFDQDASSVVSGSQLDVGYIGPGVYNLISGTLAAGHVWVGGPFQGIFNQTGGSNATGIVHLDTGGTYVLTDGDFSADAYFNSGSLFRQQGGRINAGLAPWQGTYLLHGGINSGGLTIPAFDGFSTSSGNASMVQTGGTNFSSIQLGYYGWGSYTLSNGVSLPGSIAIQARGSGQQWGGAQIVSGTFSVVTDFIARDSLYPGAYTLNGGYLSAGTLQVGGHFTQNGGTNIISGDITLNGAYGNLELTGGLLCSQNATVYASWVGAYVQSGGVQVVTNQLSISGNSLMGWKGFVLNGGQLIVSNILLGAGAKLTKTGGTISQSGVIVITAADLYLGSGTHQFGQASLQIGGSSQTNSTVHFPTNAPCIVRFKDSSVIGWDGTSTLTVENWGGSPAGGGAQQLFVGQNSSSLTAGQVRQVLFHNPAGFNPGLYIATMLPTGELVPGSAPSSPAGPVLVLQRQRDGTMQITLGATVGTSYALEISADLANWQPWTNVTSSSTSVSITDFDSTNQPRRFYRARIGP